MRVWPQLAIVITKVRFEKFTIGVGATLIYGRKGHRPLENET